MKLLLIISLFFWPLFSYSKDTPPDLKNSIALVYSGKGVCPENCAKAAAEVVQRENFKVHYITEENFDSVLLGKAKLWVQPGGNAVEVATALRPKKIKEIKSFIENGGRYLGFCAGAFLADHKVDDEFTIDGLGLIPGETKDYSPNGRKSEIFPMYWFNQLRYLYFEEGGYFNITENNNTHVLARYLDGKIAALLVHYGKGKAALSFPHPEATLAWKNANHLKDPDGEDFDLAEIMVRLLMESRK